MRSDFSLANDLAAKNPKKLAEMQTLFLKEAGKYGVLPMDDRVFERLDAAAVGRPDLMGGRTSLTLAEGMTGMLEGVFINVKNRSQDHHRRDRGAGRAAATAPSSRRAGASAAGRCTSRTACRPTTTTSSACSARRSRRRRSCAAGKAELRFQFDYDGGGPAKGGLGTLFVNGEKVAEGRIPVTQAGMFSADETADVGIDLGTPVVEAIGAEAKSRFTGRIPKVTVEVK